MKPGDIKTDGDLRPIKLKLDPQFKQIATALISHGSDGNTTLAEMADIKQWGFTSAREIAEWLEGKWLEHYVLQQFVERHEEYCVHDFGRNIEPVLIRTSSDSRALEKTEFEADIGAMRGYQLHLISCYAGSMKADCKQKLFEVFTRVRQLGGDESRAALVCCFDDPRVIEREVGQVWDIKDRVKVFGRPDLLKLGDRLRDWFATGAQ
jgi:hypothetical protein